MRTAPEPGATRVALIGSEVHRLESRHVGRPFEIRVGFPFRHPAVPVEPLPVVYLLDGSGTFGMVLESVRLMQMFRELPPLLIVGIGYPEEIIKSDFRRMVGLRARDMTPTLDKLWTLAARRDPQIGIPEDLDPGGGESFFAFLLEELRPWVEAQFATVPEDASLLGYSFGGLLAAWALFQAASPFRRYVIGSPSLYWDNAMVFRHAAEHAAREQDLPARVFLSTGELEDSSLVRRLADELRARAYPGLSLDLVSLPGETHMSGFANSLNRGLRSIYR